jgi:hypothetical protein
VRNGYLPFFLSLSGIVCIVVFGLWLKVRPASYAGLGLVLTGSLLNSLPYSRFNRLRLYLSRIKNHRYRYGHSQNRE